MQKIQKPKLIELISSSQLNIKVGKPIIEDSGLFNWEEQIFIYESAITIVNEKLQLVKNDYNAVYNPDLDWNENVKIHPELDAINSEHIKLSNHIAVLGTSVLIIKLSEKRRKNKKT